MKVSFRSTGGFAGLVRAAAVDGGELPDEDRRGLAESFFDLPETSPGQGGADLEQLSVTVEDGGRSRTLRFDRGSVPEPLHGVVRHLSRRAKFVKRR